MQDSQWENFLVSEVIGRVTQVYSRNVSVHSSSHGVYKDQRGRVTSIK